MKRLISLSIITAFLFLLASCSAPAPGETAAPPPETATPSAPGGESDVPPAEETPAPASPAPEDEPPAEDWKDVFVDFLSKSYDKLSETCFGGIAGVGFADLDLDGSAELLLFDAGASASMGVQFFDIAHSGEVHCVSANISELGSVYGGGHFVEVYVNVNFFEDFRLMEDNQSGERFFIVESGNGAEDFSYSELIRFTRDGDALKPVSLLYKYEEYELDKESDSMVVSYSRFESGGEAVGAEEYAAGLEAFFSSCTQIDYTPAGVFIWEDKNYDASAESFMLLVGTAIEKYRPVAN